MGKFLDERGLSELWKRIKNLDLRGPAGPDGNPIGTIISFMGIRAPKDYLICDGSVYKISDYPSLAAFFKEQFGSETYFGGTGGTFAVPDMRNLFLRGYRGEANMQLSGEVGKKQDPTEHPLMGVDSSTNVLYMGVRESELYSGPKKSDYNGPTSQSGRTIGNLSTYTKGTPQEWYASRPINMAVLYCIKAVESYSELGGQLKEIYSTEEIRIGTWIDGKPLYRRVYTGISAITTGEWWSPIQVDNASVITAFGWIVSNTTKMMIPNTQIRLGIIGGGVRFLVDNATAVPGYNNKDYMFVVEYTKTTDTATEPLTSKVSSKSSGSIIHDGEQYDYELPDIVSVASSAAITFDGTGSVANNI